MQNILVITMGISWQVVPEIVGFTNLDLGFFDNHSKLDEIKAQREKFNISNIDTIYVITTGGKQTKKSIIALKEWHKKYKMIDIEFFILDEVNELASIEETSKMGDFIYRVILKASEESDKLYLSLAGGRKTMSADMQQAGYFFGCDGMMHVVDRNMDKDTREKFVSFDFSVIPPKEIIDNVMPLVTLSKIKRDPIVDIPTKILSKDYPINKVDLSLYNELHQRHTNSRNIMQNFTFNLFSKSNNENFKILYMLSPDIIENLKQEYIDYQFIKKLPKAELHCHFGGIASPKEMIEIALANIEKINKYRLENQEYNKWLEKIKSYIQNNNIEELKNIVKNAKKIRKKFDISEPFVVAGFLSLFENNDELLKNLIYDKPLKSIGIEEYEKLGDLQGSGLLQTKESIQTACKILAKQCKKHNIKYIEVRCSPINYTRGGLSAKEVVEIMIEEFKKEKEIYFNLLFIGSRHGKMSDIYRHIELVEELLDTNEEFNDFFAGFDLAGAEGKRSPSKLREAFLPLMEKCIPFTIHAGETEDVSNIWEAVYYLNADRIGHGLKLKDNANLMKRFRERKITIEMCPSSNDQIIGFNGDYPLIDYLNYGLKVTINTDNPGISDTNFTKEYIKASEISNRPLTKWEALLLIKNSFDGAFLHFDKRVKILQEVEKELLQIIQG